MPVQSMGANNNDDKGDIYFAQQAQLLTGRTSGRRVENRHTIARTVRIFDNEVQKLFEEYMTKELICRDDGQYSKCESKLR
eukprot:SAG11_NODE_6938_length_1222_cov_1.242208_2_plen_80_part_01